jgi:hypothetical protein
VDKTDLARVVAIEVTLCVLALDWFYASRVSDIPADIPSPSRGRSNTVCILGYKLEKVAVEY